MRFKEFLEAGEMGSKALGMSPAAINPGGTGQGKFPGMPTDKNGDVQATPLGKDKINQVTGGPFSVGRWLTNKPRAVGLSGSTADAKEKPVPSPFASNGATVGVKSPEEPRKAGISGQLKKPGTQLNLGPGTSNPNTKSPLPKTQ